MAERNRTELKTFREDRIKEGPDGSINPELDNEVREAEAESAVNMIENRDLLNLQDYKSNRSKGYQIGEGFFKDGQLRRATFGQSGQYDSGYSQAITLPTITSVVPSYSETEELSAGQVRSFNGMLALKVGATVTGADPYDPYEFTLFNPLLPYYGVLYVQNQVYVTNMVVRRYDGSKWRLFRKVKPSGGSPEYIYSTNFATELANGEWEEEIDGVGAIENDLSDLDQRVDVNEVDIQELQDAVLTNLEEVDSGTRNLGVEDYLKNFYITGSCIFDLEGTFPVGFKVHLYLRASGQVSFINQTGLLADGTKLSTPHVECVALHLGGGLWMITNLS